MLIYGLLMHNKPNNHIIIHTIYIYHILIFSIIIMVSSISTHNLCLKYMLPVAPVYYRYLSFFRDMS